MLASYSRRNVMALDKPQGMQMLWARARQVARGMVVFN